MLKKLVQYSFILLSILFLYSCSSIVKKEGDAISSLVILQENKETRSHEAVVQNIEPVRVALVVPVTGKYQDIGEGIVNAFQLALQEHGYYFVEVSVYDTGGELSIKDISKQIVSNKTHVVVGPLFSSSLQEMKGAIPSNIPIISFSNDLKAVGSISNAYTISPTSLIDMARSISYAQQETSVENIALLVPDNSYGDAVEHAVNAVIESDIDLNLVKIIRYNPNKVDFNADVKKLIVKVRQEDERFSKVNFDTVIIGDFSKRVFLLTSQFNLLDIDSTSINIIGTLQWDNMVQMQDRVLENSYYSSLNTRNFRVFRDRYYRYYRQEPNNMAATSYDIANMILSFVNYDRASYNYSFNLTNETLLGYESSKASLGNFKFHKDRFAIRALNVKKIFANGAKVVVNRSENLDYIQSTEEDVQYIDKPSIGDLVEDISNKEEQ